MEDTELRLGDRDARITVGVIRFFTLSRRSALSNLGLRRSHHIDVRLRGVRFFSAGSVRNFLQTAIFFVRAIN